MRSNRSMMFAGIIGTAAAMASATMFPEAEPEPGSARNRPSGSKPVSGGGTRERAKRIAREVRKWIASHDHPEFGGHGETPGVTRQQINDYVAQAYPDLPPYLHAAVLEQI